MKRVTFLIAALLIGLMGLQAKPVDKTLAQNAAKKFATVQLALERAMPELVYTAENEAFYVFNLDSHSFVIIAADNQRGTSDPVKILVGIEAENP